MGVFWQMILSGLSNAAVFVLLGLGLSLLFGVLGVLNFAQGDFMGLAAYVGYAVIAGAGFGIGPAIVCVFGAMAVLSGVFYFGVLKPMRRHAHELVLVATFAGALIIQGGIQLIWGTVPVGIHRNTEAWRVGGVAITQVLVMNVVVAALAVLLLIGILERSSLGREVRATAQDRVAAELCGINTGRAELLGVFMSVVLAGVAGILLLQRVTLTPATGFQLVLSAFAVAIVGGLGQVRGVVLASLGLGLLESAMTAYINASLAEAAVYAAVIGVLILRPTGVAGMRVRI